MLLQSLKLDGFETKEVSMDILKNKECVGYTSFRNALVEQRIKLLNLNELIRETTNLEKNDLSGKIDHPKQSIIIDKVTGKKTKTVGKDLIDSLGGAVYNAILSVNLDDLNYIDSVTIADTVVIGNNQSIAEQIFGYTKDKFGNIIQTATEKEDEPEIDINKEIENTINKEIENSQNVIENIKKSNPNTKLKDQELLDMYNSFGDDGFILF